MEIPSSVNDIWNGAFSSCTSLKRDNAEHHEIDFQTRFWGLHLLESLDNSEVCHWDWGGSFWRLQFLDLENSTLFEACKEPNLLWLQIRLHICLCYHMFSNRSVQRFQALWPGLEVGEVKWKDCTLHICVRQLLRVDFFKKTFNSFQHNNIRQHSTTFDNNQQQPATTLSHAKYHLGAPCI